MDVSISKKEPLKGDKIILIENKKSLKNLLNPAEFKIAVEELKEGDFVNLSIPGLTKLVFLVNKKNKEANRRLGARATKFIKNISLIDYSSSAEIALSFIEGALLKDYHFEKYKSEKKETPRKIKVFSKTIKASQLSEIQSVVKSVFKTRDWVNEPVNQLDTTRYVNDIKALKGLGVTIDVFKKSKLKSLNMGGILGVNQGSNEEPALVKTEWKPKHAKNEKPIVLVGKGVLFDTGGINIKTGNFMTDMKADMGGSSTVLGTLIAVAKQKLPIHLIVLTPITENRINGDELVPGDVIKMHNGKTVEVLNTDAEGRLILADALSFAQKFNPELVIDVATLTGSAFRVTGHNGAVIMGTDAPSIQSLKQTGDDIYERLVELPMWEEFEDTLKSDIADLNNLGSGEGQAVCAGFFLKNFVDYPWVHLDIAGPAFRGDSKAYLPKGGTGFGVRLLYQFLKNNFATS